MLIESPICLLKPHNTPINIQRRLCGCFFFLYKQEVKDRTLCVLPVFGRMFKVQLEMYGNTLVNDTNDCLCGETLFNR